MTGDTKSDSASREHQERKDDLDYRREAGLEVNKNHLTRLHIMKKHSKGLGEAIQAVNEGRTPDLSFMRPPQGMPLEEEGVGANQAGPSNYQQQAAHLTGMHQNASYPGQQYQNWGYEDQNEMHTQYPGMHA